MASLFVVSCTLHWFNYSQVQQLCGLISDLSSQIKLYTSIRLCNRFYSGVYIRRYQFSDTFKYGYCCFKLSALLVTIAMLMPFNVSLLRLAFFRYLKSKALRWDTIALGDWV